MTGLRLDVLLIACFVAVLADSQPAFAVKARITSSHVSILDPPIAAEGIDEIDAPQKIDCGCTGFEPTQICLRERCVPPTEFVNRCPWTKTDLRNPLRDDAFRKRSFWREICETDYGYMRQAVGWRLTAILSHDLTFHGMSNTDFCQNGFDRENIGAKLSFGTFSQMIQLALASVPKPIRSSFQGEGEPSNKAGGYRGESGSGSIKDFFDLPDRDKRYVIGGTVFLMSLCILLAIFCIRRNPPDKPRS